MDPKNVFFTGKGQENLPVVERGEGIFLYDINGKRYLDGSSGPCASNLGHGNIRILDAIARQSEKVSFAHRMQFLNEPSIDLAERIAMKTGGIFSRVQFDSSGSEVVESAIKLAYFYHFSKGEATRWRVISRIPGFHGSTLGALSATAEHRRNYPYIMVYGFDFPHINAPYCYRCPYDRDPIDCGLKCANELERTIEFYGKDSISAFICEPIGGTNIGALKPPEGYYERIREICDKYGVLWIDDEVLAGYGRTGRFLAVEWWEVKPDIVTLSKGISGAYLPLAALLSREEIYQKTIEAGGFNHGQTQMGNPLCCAVGLEVLKIMEEENLIENCRNQGEILEEGLKNMQNRFDFVGDVRGKGLLWGIELVQDKKTKKHFSPETKISNKITEICRENGLLVFAGAPIDGVKGDSIAIAPPLIIKDNEVSLLIKVLEKSFYELNSHV